MPSRTLLLVFAHPDDESFLTGGTICRYAEEGVRIVLVTATRGESGKVGDPPRCTTEALGTTRELELRRAAEILGISQVHLLGYRDRDLASATPERIREELIAVIRAERPQVLVTFDPNGANLHPDHVAISRFATDAACAASDPRWHPEAGPAYALPRLAWLAGNRPWRLVREPDPGACAGVDFVIDASAWAARKLEALLAHATQHRGVERSFLSQPDCNRLLGTEFFRQAFGPPLAARPATDLFEAL